MNFPIVSIIIPVLNEAAGIVQQLARLRDFRAQGAEIIVVDGGSSDGSAERASALTDGLAMSLPGRGRQMNIEQHGLRRHIPVSSRRHASAALRTEFDQERHQQRRSLGTLQH
jgi:glycosyltransferase involved in cell wall biosynthesis